MPEIKPVPGVVVLAGVLRVLEPFQAGEYHDVRAVVHERCSLLSRRPVEIDQQPDFGAVRMKCMISACISLRS